jgi:hypothetical protein
MIKQFGIYQKTNPSIIFEVIRAGFNVIDSEKEFFSMGNWFSKDEYGYREMTEEEITNLVLLKDSESHHIRKNSEYELWKTENDKNNDLGNKSFYIGEKKFYTIDREEFKLLRDIAISEGKHIIEYRGRNFSPYHFC